MGRTYVWFERLEFCGHSALEISVASITVKMWMFSGTDTVLFQCPVCSSVAITVHFWSFDYSHITFWSQQMLITTVPMAEKEITALLAYLYWEWVKCQFRRFSYIFSKLSNNQILHKNIKRERVCPGPRSTTHHTHPNINTHTYLHFEEGNKYLARTTKKETEDRNDQSRMKEGILQLKLPNTKESEI